MLNSLKTGARWALEVAIAFAPWVIAMYVFYWLYSNGIWTSDTAHRGKMSVALLASGMGLSFLVQSHFAKRAKK
jgi:hypothetical protein